jgi:hypothetical protein
MNGFLLVTTAMVCDIIRVSPAKSCPLDPILTKILKKVLSALAPSIAKIPRYHELRLDYSFIKGRLS